MSDDGGLAADPGAPVVRVDCYRCAAMGAPGVDLQADSRGWACVDTIACADRCAANRRTRAAAAPDLVEAGKATQFAKGNQVALMHGRGRPRKNVTKLMDTLSVRSLRAMAKVAFDRTHPWHDEHGFQALRDLVKAVVPKRREITGADGEKLSIVDVHALVFKQAAGPGEDDEG